MSMASLERDVLAAAKVYFKNPKLRLKDIMEWRTAEIRPEQGEVTGWVPKPGVFVTIRKEHDKRPAK